MRASTAGAAAALFLAAVLGPMIDNRPAELFAQPTYKLDVKPHLKPLATLKLEGNRLTRTDLADDPGFRLQYHIKRADGKTVSTVEARSTPAVELEAKTAGTYSVVLELFYPAYKGGTGQKGEFKPVSNVLTYKVDAGKITLLDTPAPQQDPSPKEKKQPLYSDDSAAGIDG